MTEKYYDEWLELFGKEIRVLLNLLSEEEISLDSLSEKIGVNKTYLRRRLKPLIEKEILLVDLGESTGGRPPNLIKLSYQARQTLNQMIKSSKLSKQKMELPEISSFNKLLELLLDDDEIENVADLIQVTSRSHRIPADSYYFHFLAKHLPDSITERKIVLLLNSTKNFVSEMSEVEKTQVYESLELCLRKILGTKYSNDISYGIHRAAKELLDQLDLQNLSYIDLEKRYIAAIKDENSHPEFYRGIILSEYREHLIGLWLKVHELSKLQDRLVSSRAEVEKSFLR